MSLDPISSGIDLVTAIVNLIPNKNAQEQAELKLRLQQLISQTQLATSQIEVNKAEANSNSVFVAGGRPAIMWICAGAFAWQYVLLPVLQFFGANVLGHALIVPVVDTTSMITVLMGLLGLGAMRSYDKAVVTKNS